MFDKARGARSRDERNGEERSWGRKGSRKYACTTAGEVRLVRMPRIYLMPRQILTLGLFI